jgi:hypothetical protein
MNLFRTYPELKEAIVNLKSGTAFRGLVYRKAGMFYVMRQAVLLPDNKPIDGELLVKIDDIDFIQLLL